MYRVFGKGAVRNMCVTPLFTGFLKAHIIKDMRNNKPELVPKGRKRINQAAFDAILANGKEETFMKKDKWKLVTPPGAHLLRKYLHKEYVVSSFSDRSGWLISPNFK